MISEQRKIKTGSRQLQPFKTTDVGSDPVAWLHTQAKPEMLLLAHADDGIIWAKVVVGDDGKADFLFPANNLIAQATLRTETLLMARLFNSKQEIFLWRVAEDAWCARRLSDGEGESCEYYEESQVLWGTIVEQYEGGFACVTEGAQGMRHAPPLDIGKQDWNNQHHLRLNVRHYLCNEDGWLRVCYSRLVKLEKYKEPA